MTLDDSQRFTLESALGTQVDRKWSAFEVADIVPRQNGKGDTIQARELAGMFIFGEQLLIHTAHEFPTANEAFLRMVAVIESNRWLESKVARIRFANGEQGIELKSGQRLKYRARTGGAGRGFAGADLVVLDEAFALRPEHTAALIPTLSTSVNPQIWFASSAGMASSHLLWQLRRRAMAGNAGRLAYLEHTAETPILLPDGRVDSPPVDIFDERLVALANPAYGTRITAEFVSAERDAMGPVEFARERLGVWDAEDGALAREPKIAPSAWSACPRRSSSPAGRIVIGWDVDLDGDSASIAVAGGSIGDPYVELVEHRRGVGWLAGRLVELVERHDPIAVGFNNAGPSAAQASTVLEALKAADISADVLAPLGTSDYAAACGGLFVDIREGRLSVADVAPGPLDLAVGDVSDRRVGEGWAWDRRSATVPISPLVAVTVARALLPTEAPAASKPVFAH